MKKLTLVILLLSLVLVGGEFTLLPRVTEYTQPFFEKYPEYNGKDVTIFVMDTGVEMSFPGLKKNPDGSVKVVDVFDASRSGDAEYVKAENKEVDGKMYYTDGEDIFLSDYSEFDLADRDVFIGALKEENYKNGSVSDIDGNEESGDEWGFLAFQNDAEEWTVVMDTDKDGSLKGEEPIHKYSKNHNYIMLPRKNPLFNHQWMALAVNFYPERKVVNFHFDDGAHGTHVAGIAAGYHINGDDDVNGLAPAAKVVSIKIGNGACPGSATVTGSKKRGLEFVEKYMEEHGGYGVINLSYGIAASNEGFSEADHLFNNFAKNNPNVVVCAAAGNEGPAVSSIGTPTAAQFVISTGAIMYHTTARDKYGWELNSPRITDFSSRGGEVAKPEVVSPGAMISTVPEWSGGDFYWGTSMASPYTAGEMACILSGLQQETDNQISSALIQYGLRKTSEPLEDYDLVDQGSGMIDMLELYEWLEDEIDKPLPPHFQVMTEAFVPTLPKKKSNSIYWRIYDTEDIKDKCEVEIEAIFPEKTLQTELDDFFIKYKVDSDSRWADPVQRNITLLRENNASIDVEIDPDNIDPNSFKTARITLTPDRKYQEIGQEFWVTAINPIKFDKKNDFTYSVEGETVKPGHTNRYFIAVPHGATSMNVKLKTDENNYAMVTPSVFDKHGLPAGRLHSIFTDNDIYEMEEEITDLKPGVMELVAFGGLNAEDVSEYDLEISFSGLKFDDEESKDLRFTGGNGPSFSGQVTPVLDSYRHTHLKGTIEGYVKDHTLSFGDSDTLSVPFKKNKNDGTVKFKIHMPLKYHSNFTDLVILAENTEGKFVKSGIVSAKGNTFTLSSSLPEGHYTLKIMVAYADYVKKEKFDLPLEEIHTFSGDYSGGYGFPGGSLYRGMDYSYTVNIDDAPPMIPSGTCYYGQVELIRKDKSVASRNIRLKKE